VDDRAGLEQTWSKTLFGNQHMLQTAAVIAQRPIEFTSSDLEKVTGLGVSSVHRLLGILCDVGLLVRLERQRGERVQRYRRVRQPFWKAVSQMSERARERSDSLVTISKGDR
jgi:transcription initiation factor IIE alpha subunit